MAKVEVDYKKTQASLRKLYKRFLLIRVGAVITSASIFIVLNEIASKGPAWDTWVIYFCFTMYVTAVVYTCYQLLRIVGLIIKYYFTEDLSLKRVKKTADNRLSLRGPFFQKYYLDIE